MKRLFTLVLGISALAWSAGCCHYCGSHCADWNDGCCNDGCGAMPPQGGRHDRRHGRNECCPDQCCGDPCCTQAGAVSQPAVVGAPITSAYDPMLNMGGGGCQGCASGSLTSGLPVTSGLPYSNGCATGTCGNGASYNGMPIDSSSGWTIQPTPLNEPMPAPPSNGGGATNSSQGSSASSSVPAPTPFPTPVSSAR